MPQYPDGTRIHKAEWDRLLEAIPASYSIWKDGATYRAESNFRGGTDYGPDASFTTVLENAMDALASGGKVSLGKGTFAPTSQIDVPHDNIIVQGAGANTRIVGNVAGTDDLFQASAKNGVIIDNLYLEGQNGVGRNLITYLGCSDSTISNCYVKNAYKRAIAVIEPAGGARNAIINNICYTSGFGAPAADAETIVCGGLYKSVVANNRVYGSYQGGITLSGCFDSTVSGNTVEDSDVQNMGYGGIDFEQTVRSIISGNTVEGTGRGIRVSRNSLYNNVTGNSVSVNKEGIVVLATGGASLHNKILGNNVYNLAAEAIWIDDTCTDNQVIANSVRDCQASGILSEADYTVIVANKIYNCDVGNLGYPAIQLQYAHYNVVNDNAIRGTGRGVRLWEGSTNNTISGNSISTGKGGIRIENTGANCTRNVIIGNMVYPLTEEGIVIQAGCVGHIVKGNIVHTGQVAGILSSANFTSIVGNEVFNCDQSATGFYGIGVSSANYCQINDNLAYDTEVVPTQNQGIFLNNSTYCSVVGNLARNNAAYGIYTAGTSNYNLILSNMCAANLDGANDIVYAGANDKVAWNIGRYTPQGVE
jgi:parallel beta-helix repeat protein